jgi:hypothetical protein
MELASTALLLSLNDCDGLRKIHRTELPISLVTRAALDCPRPKGCQIRQHSMAIHCLILVRVSRVALQFFLGEHPPSHSIRQRRNHAADDLG